MNNLLALLDTLLPGDGSFPPASRTGLAARLQAHERFSTTLAPILSQLPANFEEVDSTSRVDVVRIIELDAAEMFHAFLTGVYSLYYTDPAVADAIAMHTGYETRPPQPRGYDLPAFDPALLAIPAQRQQLYRPTPVKKHG